MVSAGDYSYITYCIRGDCTSMRHLLISIFLLGCSDLDRSNPYDPINAREETAELTLSLPLGKTLASVIHRVEAVITVPPPRPS